MNKVILTGRFTREPEARANMNNINISTFSLACAGNHINQNGEKETEFIRCIAFNKLAETINKYCHKGILVSVQGRIKNSSYEAQDGTKRYTTDVIVEQLEFLSSGKSENKNINNAQEVIADQSDPYKDFAEEFVINEADLPF